MKRCTMNLNKLKQYNEYYVEWVDSVGTSGWEHIESLAPMPTARVRTLGFLIENNKDSIIIAMSISQKGLFSRLSIPKVAIKKVKRVKI